MELSRQEYWSGLPFPSQGIFLTQESNPGFLHCRQILYWLNYKERKFLYTHRKSLWWEKLLNWVLGNLDPKIGSCTDMLVPIHLTKSEIPKNKGRMRLVVFWDPPSSKISMILSFYRKINDQQKPSHMVGGARQSNKIITIKRATQLVFFFHPK